MIFCHVTGQHSVEQENIYKIKGSRPGKFGALHILPGGCGCFLRLRRQFCEFSVHMYAYIFFTHIFCKPSFSISETLVGNTINLRNIQYGGDSLYIKYNDCCPREKPQYSENSSKLKRKICHLSQRARRARGLKWHIFL